MGSVSSSVAARQACFRYSRDVLLRLYADSSCPFARECTEETKEVRSEVTLPPCQLANQRFRHPLGDQVNSRSTGKDWPLQKRFFLPNAAPAKLCALTQRPATPTKKELRPLRVVLGAGSRNVPLDFSLSGTEVASEGVRFNPDAKPWVSAECSPKYHVSLLQERQLSGDPFAAVLLDSGIADSRGFLAIPAYSSACERCWFYRDPQGCLQGPFSSVEMFNWNAAGYFTPDLLVAAHCKASLEPLATYGRRGKRCYEHEAEMTTMHLKCMRLSAVHSSRSCR